MERAALRDPRTRSCLTATAWEPDSEYHGRRQVGYSGLSELWASGDGEGIRPDSSPNFSRPLGRKRRRMPFRSATVDLGDTKGEVCTPEVWRRSSRAVARTTPQLLPVSHGSPGLSRLLKRADRSPVILEPRRHRSPWARPQLTGRRRLDTVAGCVWGEAPAVLKLRAWTARRPPPSGPPSLLPAALSRARLPAHDVRSRRSGGRDHGRPPGTPPSPAGRSSSTPQSSRELEVSC